MVGQSSCVACFHVHVHEYLHALFIAFPICSLTPPLGPCHSQTTFANLAYVVWTYHESSRMNQSDLLQGVETRHHSLPRVRFDQVQIREYERIPRDHLSFSRGPSSALELCYRDLETVDVLKYEQLRGKRRSFEEMKISRGCSSKGPRQGVVPVFSSTKIGAGKKVVSFAMLKQRCAETKAGVA